uniref:uncharacterized protein LOC118555508 isoform X2 n=1 Tax=Halichoerus grypus TaxID=9711 RepID=UPI00165913CA|nr:uncharacterized protein LOC118555508 isoform X2 [Halichoerus grypus]
MHAFDGSSLSSPSFSCPFCLHVETSWLSGSGPSGKGAFSLRSCSPSFSDVLRMGFSPGTWGRSGGWLFSAFLRKLTVSLSTSLLRSVLIADKHRARNEGGLATTAGGLRAASACGVGPLSSRRAPHTSWRAEALWPSAFALLRVSRLFTRRTSSTVHSSTAQGNTGRLGLCPQLPEISSSAPHRCSNTSWQVDPAAEGGPSMAASGSTALSPSARVLWPQLTTQNPVESSTYEVGNLEEPYPGFTWDCSSYNYLKVSVWLEDPSCPHSECGSWCWMLAETPQFSSTRSPILCQE